MGGPRPQSLSPSPSLPSWGLGTCRARADEQLWRSTLPGRGCFLPGKGAVCGPPSPLQPAPSGATLALVLCQTLSYRGRSDLSKPTAGLSKLDGAAPPPAESEGGKRPAVCQLDSGGKLSQVRAGHGRTRAPPGPAALGDANNHPHSRSEGFTRSSGMPVSLRKAKSLLRGHHWQPPLQTTESSSLPQSPLVPIASLTLADVHHLACCLLL